MTAYVTVRGDVLDAIAHRLMGGADRVVALMEANRHAAHLPAVLPAGLTLTIPAVAEAAAPTVAPVRLWGRA